MVGSRVEEAVEDIFVSATDSEMEKTKDWINVLVGDERNNS